MARERLNVPVQMTRKGRKMFSPPYTGTLVRLALDGRWVVKRENRATVDYWARGFWRKSKIEALEQQEVSRDR